MITEGESPVTFTCQGAEVLGILHNGDPGNEVVVVFVVGGPQYRVGSHRMFLDLARALAANGVGAFRFDCRGMGDSDGTFTSFEDISDDIRSAIDVVVRRATARAVVLVGLCDGASASAMYVAGDDRVCGLVLLNPWVRTQASEARARVEHYYRARFRQPEFWRRLVIGRINVVGALVGYVSNLYRGLLRGMPQVGDYIFRMQAALSSFHGRILVVLAQHDLTAQEFEGLVRNSEEWRTLMNRQNVAVESIGADHTFSGDGQLEIVLRAIDKLVAACKLELKT